MRIAILSAGQGWHVRDLERAGRQIGVAVEWVDFRSLCAWVGGGESSLSGGGRRRRLGLNELDGVLVRTMPAGSLEQIVYRMDALHALQAQGVTVLNSPRALETAVDKYLSLARLAAASLPVPRTFVCEHAADAAVAFDECDGDAVYKPLFGSEGKGLKRLTERDEALRHFEELEARGDVIYLQRFVDHPGWDLRVLVVGGESVAAMRRSADSGWITNVSRGGRAEAIELAEEASHLAVRATAAVGAQIAGVDLVPDRDGMLRIVEVNAVPGWRALRRVCSRDLAKTILEHVLARATRTASP